VADVDDWVPATIGRHWRTAERFGGVPAPSSSSSTARSTRTATARRSLRPHRPDRRAAGGPRRRRHPDRARPP
jgi:hypothetical protein